MENSTAKYIDYKGIKAIELEFDGYYAIIAPTIGTNVLRFRDNVKGMEIFRYSDDVSIAEIINAPEIWGLPTLYLPNRLDGGVLKTSDAVYQLPVNEAAFKNHLHGFIQKRSHIVKDMGADNTHAFVTTSFIYDETDFFYNCFPIKFTCEITIDLSKDGLKHTISLTNLSEKMMPISVCTHTTINAPFVDGGLQENILLQVPCKEKLIFDKERWLPTGETQPLNDWDLEYKNGTKCPVLQDICNDMYSAATLKIDDKDFYGVVMTDTASGKKIYNEIDEKYKFWIVWNHEGFMNYFCPEPMTAQVNAPNLDMSREKSGYTEIKPNETYSVSQRFFTV